MQGPKWPIILLACEPVVVIVNCLGQVVFGYISSYKGDSARFSWVMSSYPTSTNIPRVDGLSTRHPGFGASQLGIRVKVNDYLGSSVGVFISLFLIPASQLGIRA